jgi:hypothetical protein
MPTSARTLVGQRLAATFVLGWLLFNYPLMELFNQAREVFGIPLLYAYVFIAWALFIGLLAFIVKPKAGQGMASAPAVEE